MILHTAFYFVAIHSSVVSHCLVHWSGEGCIAVMSRQQVLGQHIEVGKEYSVKWGKKCYKASVAAIGECIHVARCVCVCRNACQQCGYATYVGVCTCSFLPLQVTRHSRQLDTVHS